MIHYQTDGTPADLADLSDNAKVAEFDDSFRKDGRQTGMTESFLLDPDGDGTFQSQRDGR